MEQILLKKSCDSCTMSKVKCIGGNPCERCSQRGVHCYFSPRKKRTRIKKEEKEEVDLDIHLGVNKKGHFLDDWEQRSWSVFFTLYKHYNNGCCNFWFSAQLSKMLKFLEDKGSRKGLARLKSWMGALDIKPKELDTKLNTAMLAFKRISDCSPPLGVDGVALDDANEFVVSVDHNNPYLKVRTRFFSFDQPKDEGITVSCNKPFSDIFGMTGSEIRTQLESSGGGFLPWGGDILARLATTENDLLTFVQIMAIKFNSLGPPPAVPCTRTVPSVHHFDLISRGNPMKTFIKCAHIEEIGPTSGHLTVCLEFIPLGSIPLHMPAPSKTLLKMPTKIEPFRSKKRKTNLERFEFPDMPNLSLDSDSLAQELPTLGSPDQDSVNTQTEWLDELLGWVDA